MAFLKPRAVLRQGVRADQPAAADVAEGALYFVTDENVTEQQIASAWVPFGTLYEEGAWTPVLTFGGGSTGLTYSSQVGRYVRIGKFVALTGFMQLSSKGSSTGNASISGLPATIGSTSAFFTSTKVSYSGFTAGVQEVGLQSTLGSTSMIPVKSVTGTNTQLTDVDFGATSLLIMYFCFIIE